jgi:phosphoribosylformylglycinamidine synthase
MVKVASLFTAGTNCDEETMLAFERAGAKADRLHLNRLKKNRHFLEKYQILAIPGGFTYGDYISAGKILANELQYILEDSIAEFIQAGKLIIGICNGFQVLAKAGILPGFSHTQSVTLDVNDSNRFECRWVYLKANRQSPCIFTKDIDLMSVPVAHAEGKFVVDSQKTLDAIKKNNQDVFSYVNQKGGKAQYPDNPNGSIADIAGICDTTGRIFGLMPHPERASSIYQYPDWFVSKHMQEPIGLKVFKNAVTYAQANL